MNKEEHYADEVLAEQLLLVGGGVVRKRSNVGSSFKIIEDIMLASPYVFVTTKAAVGTDQDGNTFWDKICKSFIKRGGQEGRTRVCLKNRFNKVLQAEINKYVGCLHSVLCEYHSGWVLDDYTAKGKTRFQLKHGKTTFKHDVAYSILKKALPKYEIILASCDSRVAHALFLLNTDKEVSSTAGQQGDDERSPDGHDHDDTVAFREDASDCLLVTHDQQSARNGRSLLRSSSTSSRERTCTVNQQR
jgi:hypothetical protein